MKLRYGKENLTRFSKDMGIGPGTASRIKEMKTSVGIDVLTKIATKCNLQPWHLILPGLDPTNAPVTFLSEEEKQLYIKMKKAREVLIT